MARLGAVIRISRVCALARLTLSESHGQHSPSILIHIFHRHEFLIQPHGKAFANGLGRDVCGSQPNPQRLVAFAITWADRGEITNKLSVRALFKPRIGHISRLGLKVDFKSIGLETIFLEHLRTVESS